MEHEPPQSPRTALKDSTVNLRLGTGGLQAKVDYRADSPQGSTTSHLHHSLLFPAAHTRGMKH